MYVVGPTGWTILADHPSTTHTQPVNKSKEEGEWWDALIVK